MTYRIKTWANNVLALELEIFASLKLCDPPCVTRPPSTCISFVEKLYFSLLVFVVVESGENYAKFLVNNNILKYIK